MWVHKHILSNSDISTIRFTHTFQVSCQDDGKPRKESQVIVTEIGCPIPKLPIASTKSILMIFKIYVWSFNQRCLAKNPLVKPCDKCWSTESALNITHSCKMVAERFIPWARKTAASWQPEQQETKPCTASSTTANDPLCSHIKKVSSWSSNLSPWPSSWRTSFSSLLHNVSIFNDI